MSKITIRNALSEGEILPYQETDLSSLPPQQGRTGDGQGNEGGGEPVPLEDLEGFSSLTQEGSPVLDEKKPAENPVEKSRRKEDLQKEAHQQDVARGREEGREEARKELLPALGAFAQAGQSLIVLEEQLVSRLTTEIVGLAMEIAEKVVNKKVEDDPQITASVLERARAEIPHAREVRIWLNPVDYQALSEMRPDLVRIGKEEGRNIEVVASEEIGRGGCRVETELGVIDATIPTQMEEITKQLLKGD